ncbi:MAG: DUF2336 domain-containing protein [Sphingomonadales bacterium]|nr:DUF2336 domain-containing protein [Sphingomonadales bacterium]
MLTVEEAKKFLNDPSTGHRVEMAEKIGNQLSEGKLSKEERTIAEDIFRLMVRDAEVRVRKALAESLKDSPDVPRDVALSLSADVNEVSIPVIESSIVLSDEDLISIIDSRGASAQSAVAKRAYVSSSVSDALVATENEDVIATLVSNDGADISEDTMENVLDKYGKNEKINAPMAQRGNLPIQVSERLVSLVSEKMRDHLVAHHELPDDVATDLFLDTRERATVSLLEPGNKNLDVEGLVDQLYKNHRLTSTIILRALCLGDLTFFETAVAKKAGVPVANAYQLIHDKGTKPLELLLQKANMPLKSLPMVRAALDISRETMDTDGDDRDKFQQKMIERLLTQMEDEFDGEHLDYFINKLGA